MLDPATISIEDDGAPPPPSGITPIALDQLMLSNLNVRQTERDADIASLAEDIAARGLKQNLVVVPAHFATGVADADWSGKFEVVAGGRRYQALALLVGDGRLPADHHVPCLVEAREEARETSLSENLHRVAMNPADEFEAFRAIVVQEGGGSPDVRPGDHTAAVAYCAKRFGVTVRHVDGRLRLASLAPEILQALRENKIGIESAKAYAGVPDHKLQLKVFKEHEKNSWKAHDPRAVRDALRGKTCSTTDHRVIYIGLDAYCAAGGVVAAEMFMGSDEVERVINVALLDKLAKAKAEESLPALAKEHGFKDALFATRGSYDINRPKAPAGFAFKYEWGVKLDDISKPQRKKSIAVFAIARDGSGLTYECRLVPEAKDAGDQAGGYKAPTAEEIAAQRREEGIDRLSARLAVGTFAGSPFEGRAFWPGKRWIDPIEQINDDEVAVAVLVRVTAAQIEAQREAAEKKYDEELAEAEAEKARLMAEAAAAEDNPVDAAEALDLAEADADDEDDEVAE